MRFECVQCGGCCRQHGALRLLTEDIERMAEYLGLSADEFRERYGVQHIYKDLHYIELHDGCIFLTADDRCSINPAKPFFCENYIPYVDRPGTAIYQVCQGIGKGREWTEYEIQKRYDRMIEKLVIVKDGDA